uniref:PCI domain-containing protein n=1 Tax=Macrostomum lignano TaxID=282301 RepID=A0A1I8HNN5_9PLAT
MSEEVKKMEIDYSSQVDELIPKATELASHGKLNEALDLILSLEKHTRSASDAISTGRLLVCIAQLCYRAKNWQALNDYLLTMSKKRGQSKQAVETFGSMEKREKVEFILEQMRLCLAKRDYIRTQIISKKVNPKFFQTEPDSELKEKYYTLMIELHSHDKSYLSISKHHAAILQSCQPDTDKFRLHLRCCLANLLLAPHDNEQHDLLQRSLRHHARALESEPDYAELCGQFSGRELINWSELSAEHAERLRADCRLSDEDIEALRKRVTEHNVRVLAAYYTNIGLARAAHLLSLDVPDAEQAISDQVVSGAVSAKIDRLTGVVHFSTAQSATQLLTDWAHSLDSVMRLVGEVGHLINKERMVHQPA